MEVMRSMDHLNRLKLEAKGVSLDTSSTFLGELLDTSSLLDSCLQLPLVQSERDLLKNSSVLVWELSLPLFTGICSHRALGCTVVTTHPLKKKLVQLLFLLHSLLTSLGAWTSHPALLGELTLKLLYLLENKASRLRPDLSAYDTEGVDPGLLRSLSYDRSALLEALQVALAGLGGVNLTRTDLDCREYARLSCPSPADTDGAGSTADQAVRTACDTVRITTESGNATDETERTTGETERTTGESVSTTGETVSTTGETVSTTGETVNTTDKSVSATGETVSTTGETVSTTGESVRTTGESVSTTGESVRTTGESVRTTAEDLSAADEGEKTVGGSRQPASDDPRSPSNIALLHIELLCCYLRLRVKLARTQPPDPASRPRLHKTSSLKNKVEEQNKMDSKHEKLLALISSPDAQVCTVEEVHAECEHNPFLSSLLLMQEALVHKDTQEISACLSTQASNTTVTTSSSSSSKTQAAKQASSHTVTTSSSKTQAGTHTNSLPSGQSGTLPDSTSNSSSSSSSLQQALSLLKGLPLTLPKHAAGKGRAGSGGGACPAPPILVTQSETGMTFVPPAFSPPGGDKVVWYSLYGRTAAGSNVKVRLNDNTLPGLAVPVPAGPRCKLEVKGLEPNRTYVFAVAAYAQDGHLIGGSIGDTGKPILSAQPLPAIAAYTHLCKVAYDVGCFDVAASAGGVVWGHFVEVCSEDPPTGGGVRVYRLRRDVASSSSAQLLTMLVRCVFVLVDIRVQEGGVSYTRLHWTAVPHRQQALRLSLCRMLAVAVELGEMLRDPQVPLQAVATCYALLAPLIQHDLMTDSLGEVALVCLRILRCLPRETLSDHSPPHMDHLHHMIAVISYQGLKILHAASAKGLVAQYTGSIKELLAATLPPSKSSPPGTHPLLMTEKPPKRKTTSPSGCSAETAADPTTSPLKPRRVRSPDSKSSMKRKSKVGVVNPSSLAEEHKSEGMRALETCFAMWRGDSHDHELTGQEDIMLLYGTIASEHVTQAYREVRKFRRRPRYLEFFVHLCSKAIGDGYFHDLLEWSSEVLAWLKRRNELITQAKVPKTKKREATTLTGEQARYTNTVQKFTEKPKSHVMRHYSRLNIRPQDSPLKALSRTTGAEGTGESAPAWSHRKGSTMSTPSEESRVALVKLDTSHSYVVAHQSHPHQPHAHQPHAHQSHPHQITKDDLITKAKSVLSTLMTDLYRHSVRRKKLRTVSVEEYPWRVQLHLMLAHCRLERLSSLLRPHLVGSEEGAEFLSPSLLLYNNASTLISGLLGSMVEVKEIARSEDGFGDADGSENISPPRMPRDPPATKSILSEVKLPAIQERSESKCYSDHALEQEEPTDDVTQEVSSGELKQEVTAEEFKREASADDEKKEVPTDEVKQKVSFHKMKRDSVRDHDHLGLMFTGEDVFSGSSTNGHSPKKVTEKSTSAAQEISLLPAVILHFRKAIVLAQRGRLWVLLQNVCRDLYSSLTNLGSLFHQISSSSATSTVVHGVPGSAELRGRLHSLSSRTLYLGSRALLDMVASLQEGGVGLVQQFPDLDGVSSVSSAGAGAGAGAGVYVSELPVDLLFLVRFSLLALQVLLKASLWERLVDLCCLFNTVTSYKYSDKTVPLLKHAQQELMVRMTGQHYTRKVQALHPAAHLDPAGYDVYGPHGHALGLTAQPLQPLQSTDVVGGTQPSLSTSSSSSSTPPFSAGMPREGLARCRALLSRYLAHLYVKDLALPVPPEVGSLSADCVRTIVAEYRSTADQLRARGEGTLCSVSLLELGTLHYHQGQTKEAGVCWREGLDTILGSKDCLKQRSSLFKSPSSALDKLGYQALWTALVLVGKIVKYVCVHALQTRLEYALLGRAVAKSLLSTSLDDLQRDDLSLLLLHSDHSGHSTSASGHAHSTMGQTHSSVGHSHSTVGHAHSNHSFVAHSHSSKSVDPNAGVSPPSATGHAHVSVHHTPFPGGHAPFPSGGDLYGLSSQCVVDSLQQISTVLVERKYFQESAPVLYLYEHFSYSACRAVQHCAQAALLTVRVWAGLGVFSQAFARMKALIVGAHLPQDHTHSARPLESHGYGRAYYDDSQPATHPRNFKILVHLLEKQVPPGLLSQYGPRLLRRITLARADLYVALAGCMPGLPAHSTFRKSSGSGPTAAIPGLLDPHGDRGSSPGSSAPSGPSPMDGHSTAASSPGPDSQLQVPPTGEVKSTLLRHAESLLLSIALAWEDEEEEELEAVDVGVVTRTHLSMAALGMALHMPTVAANAALSALRFIQENEKRSGNQKSHSVAGPLMWLECQQALAWSLVHLHSHPHPHTSPLSFTSVCAEGGALARKAGLPEAAGWFHWCRAVHLMTHSPGDAARAVAQLESSLKCLDGGPLSARGKQVKSQVSFHLASLLLSSAPSGWTRPQPAVVEVYQTLVQQLSNQVVQLNGLSHSHTPPHKNVYLPHLDLLARCHLVVGRCRLAGGQCREGLHELRQGLEICRQSYRRWNVLEAQLLLALSEATIQAQLDLTSPHAYLQPALWLLEVLSIASSTNTLHLLCESALGLLARLFHSRSTVAPAPAPPPAPPSPSSGAERRRRATPTERDRLTPSSRGVDADHRTASGGLGGGVSTEPSRSRSGSRQWLKDRQINVVVVWCALQALRLTQLARKRLEDSIKELGRQELNKNLGPKALAGLSDGVLLALVSGDHSYAALTGQGAVPLEDLAPSSLLLPLPSATWRQVLVHLSRLRLRVWPQHSSPATGLLYSPPLAQWSGEECDWLHRVLQNHLPSLYADFSLPVLPRLIPDHLNKMATRYHVPQPCTALLVPTQGQVEKWYSAAEPTVHLMWEGHPRGDRVRGVAAFNLKPVKHISSFSLPSTAEIHLLGLGAGPGRLQLLADTLATCSQRARAGSASKQSAKSRKTNSAKRGISADIQAVVEGVLKDLIELSGHTPPEKLSCPAVSLEVLEALASLLDSASPRVLQAKRDVCSVLAVAAKAQAQPQ